MSQTFIIPRSHYESIVEVESRKPLTDRFPTGIIVKIDDDGVIQHVEAAYLAEEREPDMSRMGEKHIKECRGCPAMLLWAKHEKTGKVAPLVKAKEGEMANIMAWYDTNQDQWFYKIKGAKSQIRGTPEYVNHFMNCERSKDFKKAPLTEDEERAAAIK